MRFSATATTERILPARIASRLRGPAGRVDALIAGKGAAGVAGRLSLIAFVVRVASAAIVFLSQVLLARWMGSFDYGIYVLVWTAIVILGVLACFGFNTSINRFIPEFIHTSRSDELRGVIFASRMFVLCASSAVALFGLGLLWAFADFVEPYYVLPFAMALVALPIISLSAALEGIARGNDWGMLALVPVFVVRPLLILALMGAMVLAGWQANAVSAVMAALVATFLTTLYQLHAVTGAAEAAAGPGPRKIEMRLWLAISLPIFLGEGFFFLLSNVDVLMVGYFLEPDDVAFYFAAVKTLALVHFVYFAIKAGAAQRYSQYAHSGELEMLAIFARKTAAWTFWPSLGAGLAMLVIGKPLLSLFGEGFGEGYPLLFVLVLGVVARASVGPADSVLAMTGHQRACAVVYAVTLVVALALNALLIPLLGLWGAAIATATTMVFEALLVTFVIHAKLGFVMFVFWPEPKGVAA